VRRLRIEGNENGWGVVRVLLRKGSLLLRWWLRQAVAVVVDVVGVKEVSVLRLGFVEVAEDGREGVVQ